MAGQRMGITVDIGGNVSGLSKAISTLNKPLSNIQTELKQIERLLKLDPGNTELLAQKQELLSQKIDQTKTKLDTLRQAKDKADDAMADGTEVNQEQYRKLQREIISTEQQLADLEQSATQTNNEMLGGAEASADEFAALADEIDETTSNLKEAGDEAQTFGDKLGTAISNAGGKLKSIGEGVSSFGDSITDAGKSLTTLTAPVAGLSAAVVKTGVEFKAFKQEAKQAFTVMLGSAEEAETHMDNIMAFAKTTPFAFPDLVSANRKLVSFGMTADDTFPVMDAIANAVAAMGGGASEIDTLSDVFAKIQSNGKITGEELNRLSDNGINALKILANQAGVSMDEMREMISSGAVDSETAINGLVDGILNGSVGINGSTVAMGGSLEALKDTFGGAIDSMKGAWRNMADEVISDELFDSIIEAINLLTDVIKQLGPILAPLADEFGQIFISIVEKLSEVVQWFLSLDPAIQQNILKAIAFATVLGPVLVVIGTVISKIGSLISVLGSVTEGIGFLTSNRIPAIGSALSFLAANPIVLVIAAVVALIAIIANFGDEIQEVLGRVDEFMQNIFAKDWTEVFGPVLGGALNTFFANLKNIWDSIMQIFNGIIDFIRGVFTGDWDRAWNGVKNIFSGVFNMLLSIAKAPINGIIGLLNMAISGINTLLRGLNKVKFNVPSWVPGIGGKSFGINIPEIPKIAYLASGGILSAGSAIVGERGPELLSMLSGGRAQVTPLANNPNAAAVGTASVIIKEFNNYDTNTDIPELTRKIQFEMARNTTRGTRAGK